MVGDDYAGIAAANWLRLRGELELSSFVVGKRIMRLSAILHAALDDAISASGFTVLGDYDVMSLLRRAEEPILPSEIADRLRMTRAGITGRLDRLESRGFVRRERSGDDSRNVLVSLTARGRKATDHAFDQILACEAEMFGGLSAEQLVQLGDLLRLVSIEHDPASDDR